MDWYRVLTGPQPAGVAVIEVGGPGVGRLLRARCGREVDVGRLGHVKISDWAGEVIDDPVIWRASAERAEISVHGGPEIVRQVVTLLEGEGFGRSERGGGVMDLLPLCRTELAVQAVVEGWPEERRRWLLSPPTVAVVGDANVGKSTLVNRLAGVEASITADIAGTTRDFVVVEGEVGAAQGGLMVRWMDTPGFRETSDVIEAEAIELARSAVSRADAVVLVVDSVAGDSGVQVDSRRMLKVLGRADLRRAEQHGDLLRVSAVTGEGVDELKAWVARAFGVG